MEDQSTDSSSSKGAADSAPPLRLYDKKAVAPEDPAAFKARPMPKSTLEYKPPPSPSKERWKRSVAAIQHRQKEASSQNTFKARPAPKSTFEYQEPKAAASPKKSSPPKAETIRDRWKKVSAAAVRDEQRQQRARDDHDDSSSVSSSTLGGRSAVSAPPLRMYNRDAASRTNNKGGGFKAKPLPSSTYKYTPPPNKRQQQQLEARNKRSPKNDDLGLLQSVHDFAPSPPPPAEEEPALQKEEPASSSSSAWRTLSWVTTTLTGGAVKDTPSKKETGIPLPSPSLQKKTIGSPSSATTMRAPSKIPSWKAPTKSSALAVTKVAAATNKKDAAKDTGGKGSKPVADSAAEPATPTTKEAEKEDVVMGKEDKAGGVTTPTTTASEEDSSPPFRVHQPSSTTITTATNAAPAAFKAKPLPKSTHEYVPPPPPAPPKLVKPRQLPNSVVVSEEQSHDDGTIGLSHPEDGISDEEKVSPVTETKAAQPTTTTTTTMEKEEKEEESAVRITPADSSEPSETQQQQQQQQNGKAEEEIRFEPQPETRTAPYVVEAKPQHRALPQTAKDIFPNGADDSLHISTIEDKFKDLTQQHQHSKNRSSPTTTTTLLQQQQQEMDPPPPLESSLATEADDDEKDTDAPTTVRETTAPPEPPQPPKSSSAAPKKITPPPQKETPPASPSAAAPKKKPSKKRAPAAAAPTSKQSKRSIFRVRLSGWRILKNLIMAVIVPPLVSVAWRELEAHYEHRRLLLLHRQQTSPFPLPVLPKGKRPPNAVYTSRSFATGGGEATVGPDDSLTVKHPDGSSSFWSNTAINVHLYHNKGSGEGDNSAEVEDAQAEKPVDDAEHAFHEPAGQHLILDISNVDSTFLRDMEWLAHAMISVTEKSQLTLLSYHCHRKDDEEAVGGGGGVSCMGVLLESHLSLHTWPDAGILLVDLFTCGRESLLPLVPAIQDLFAIASPKSSQTRVLPVLRWLHKKRGFREAPGEKGGDASAMPAELGQKSVDLEAYLLGWMGYQDKKILVNVQTPFQQVQIYQASLLASPPLGREQVSSNDAVGGTNKMLYLDGVMRSSLHGLEPYHEALVHPALMSHEQPRRVAILGGGEGATLREVLKHGTVEQVVMVERDATLVDLSRAFLPEWNDCSGVGGRTTAKVEVEHSSWFEQKQRGNRVSCFDDDRVELHLEDAFAWFVERYGRNATTSADMDTFDVVIMDALDLSYMSDFLESGYADEFFYALTRALGPAGILVSQIGKVEKQKEGESSSSSMDRFGHLLQKHGAQAMKTYSESHGQLLGPWEFRIVWMDASSSSSSGWMERSAAEWSRRAAQQGPLEYFDAATFLSSYQHPSRMDQDNFVATQQQQESTLLHHSFDPDVGNVAASALEVQPVRKKQAKIHRRDKMGVFASLEDDEALVAAQGSYLFLQEVVNRLAVLPATLQLASAVGPQRASTALRALVAACQEQPGICQVLVEQPHVLSFVACREAPQQARPKRQQQGLCSSRSNSNNDFFDPSAARHWLTAAAKGRVPRVPLDVKKKKGVELVVECPHKLGKYDGEDVWHSWLLRDDEDEACRQ